MYFSWVIAWAMAEPPVVPDSSDGATEAAPTEPTPSELRARIEALEREILELQLTAALQPAPTQGSAGRASFNALNPGITAYGDLVGQAGIVDGGLSRGSTLYLRSLELELRADVDPYAKADAVIAWEQEPPPLEGGPGEGFGSEPEEVYVDLVALPLRLSARIGKFRVPFGLVNRSHPHDLPWVDAPELLGEEGYNDSGAVLGWLLPLGPAGLTLTGGALSGEPFDPDGSRANLAGLGRAELFVGAGDVGFSLGGSTIADIGASPTTGAPYLGGDLSLRWRPSTQRSVIVMAEVVDAEAAMAAYAALQVQFARMWTAGLRQDLGAGSSRTGVYLTGYTSEFFRVRLGGGFDPESGAVDVLSQLTFIWGSHPVEPWWVNR